MLPCCSGNEVKVNVRYRIILCLIVLYVSTFLFVSRANLVTTTPLSYPPECLQRDYLSVSGRLLARFLLSLLDCPPFSIPRACPSNLPINAVREFAINF